METKDLIILLKELQALSKESEWVEFKVNNSNPQEIGESIASRIIGDTIAAGFIKDYDTDNESRKYAKYVPYWT